MSSKSKFDVKIEKVKYTPAKGLFRHNLLVKLSGKDMHIKIVNMMRRVASNNIPVFGWARDLIQFNENTSYAYNNDMLSLNLQFLPIHGVDPDLYELDEKYWYNVNYKDPNREKHSNEKSIRLRLNYENKTNDIVELTTQNVEVHVDNELTKMYNDEYPFVLLELKPKEKINLHMVAVLGIAERRDDGATWKGCNNVHHNFIEEEKNGVKQDSKTDFTLKIIGKNQFSEKDMIIRICDNIISKMNKMRDTMEIKLENKSIELQQKMTLVLENEDFTYGDPINYEMQSDEKVKGSGFAKPNHDIKTSIITCEIRDEHKDKYTPVHAFINATKTIRDKFEILKKQAESISLK